MLYSFLGSDRKKIKEALSGFLKDSQKFSIYEYDSLNWNTEEVGSLLGNEALFSGQKIVVLRFVFENKEALDFIENNLEEMSSSTSNFLIVEEIVPKKIEKKLEKLSEKFYKYEKKETITKRPFNVFQIAEAFGNKDKKKTWVLYEEALDSGMTPEEIHPILFWQIKSMLAAKNSQDAFSADLKPFVYSKSKKYAEHFSNREMIDLSRKLNKIHSDSRTGKVHFDIALERFILDL